MASRPEASASLLLLPGMHGTGLPFEDLQKLIPSRVLELPKEGAQDYRSLERWLAAQRFPEAYVLLAESFSGPLALRFASKRPQGLKGLVFLGSFCRMPLPLPWLWAALTPPLPLSKPIFRRGLQRMLFSGQADQAQLERMAEALRPSSAWILRRRMQAVLSCDLRHLLPSLQLPVLAIRGKQDHMVPLQALDDFKSLPQVQLAELESPHVISAMRPKELVALLRPFLRTCLKARSRG